jgi:hypothetical protein
LRKASASFLKKRSKKLSVLGGVGTRLPEPAVSKSFLLPRAGRLFFKKEALSFTFLETLLDCFVGFASSQ